jgi:acyl-CoA synthetase (AMP-forming)/AMP-acid ligase II
MCTCECSNLSFSTNPNYPDCFRNVQTIPWLSGWSRFVYAWDDGHSPPCEHYLPYGYRTLMHALLQGMEARILREDGSDADFGEPGEIYLRGKNVGLGYWNNEIATKETFLPDSWLRTGDRFKADAEGRFLCVLFSALRSSAKSS